MNEIRTVEDVHRFLAEYDRAHPHWRAEAEEDKKRAVERRKREAEAEQQARNAREAEKQQAASNDWYAAVDTRVRAHFKDWAWAAIDERIDALTQRWWEHEWDVLKDAIGGALGKKAAQVRDELKRAIEEQQRVFEAKLTEQKERLNNSADEAQGRLREEFRRALEETVASAGAEIAALEQRLKAMPGRLPVVKTWRQESVSYQAELVCHEGALWQARKDTAQPPGGSDWLCVARAGRDGLTPNVRGTFNVHKKYRQLDVAEFDGSSFVALRDNPGTPGDDGWQVLSRSGRRGPVGDTGPRGSKGERGARGEAAPTIINWTIDPVHYRAVPTMSDGTFGAPLDLRPLFEAYHIETS